MIELVRVVEHQASLFSYRATKDEDRAVQLELLIESTKPKNKAVEWHSLIATPFRYAPPHPEARFRPAYGKNVFYGALAEETALYEHSFYFMKQRLHLKVSTETGIRSIFFVDADDDKTIDITSNANCAQIMDKKNYAYSHQFISKNPTTTFIIYPSCRDPLRRPNAAVLSILHLAKKPKWEAAIKFFYNNNQRQINWLDYPFTIHWDQVS